MNANGTAVAGHGWLPGPAAPRLPDGAVHVWRADLRTLPPELATLLDGNERERAERMLDEHRRRLWSRGRGLLRTLLGSYLRVHPATVRLRSGPGGKPELATGSLSFNLSHSAQTALLAFSAAGAVGVDVEMARRRFDAVRVAERAFGPAEARRLAALAPEVRGREFRRAWVRHEAALKCLGSGVLGAGAERQIPWVTELEIDGSAAGAVATLARPGALQRWDWTPSGG
jgi:4'-phosphopantetheinyl transferase